MQKDLQISLRSFNFQKTHLLCSISYLLILITGNLFCQVSSRIYNYRLLCFSFSVERLGAGLQWRRTVTTQGKVMATCPELKCCTWFPYKCTLNCIKYCFRIIFIYFIYLFGTTNVGSILQSNPKLLGR